MTVTQNPFILLAAAAAAKPPLAEQQLHRHATGAFSPSMFQPIAPRLTTDMGKQIHHGKQSIAKCKQGAAKFMSTRRYQKSIPYDPTQRGVNDISKKAFFSPRDCRQCAAEKKGHKPHKSHHALCPKSRKTGGQSATAVESTRATDRLSTLQFGWPLTGQSHQSVASSFPHTKATDTNPVVDNSADTTQLPLNCHPNDVIQFLEKAVKGRQQSKLECAAPEAMVALAEAIMEQVKHKKAINISSGRTLPRHLAAFREAADRFESIFGRNNMVYTVPEVTDLDRPVDPGFHSIAGSKFIYMDMEVAFPWLPIKCCECGSSDLSRDRDIYSHDKRLFPIVEDGVEVWCLPFRYKCRSCPGYFSTNDGAFLATLPACIRNQYPVEPRYAFPTHSQHLSKSLTATLHEDMATFSNANEFVQKVARRKNEHYLSRVEDYYSRRRISGRYLDVSEVVRTYPQSASTCQTMHLKAELSDLNPEGVAAKDRYERIIQSAKVKDIAAIDHTFATLKNYELSGAKATFTVVNEEGLICNMVCVPSEKVEEVDHMVQMMQTRRPAAFGHRFALYSDTWPKNKDYWEGRFEEKQLEGKLGLSNYIHQLTNHFNPGHRNFFIAKDRLQRSIYKYDKDQLKNLLAAMKAGHFGDDGRKLSLDNIQSIRLSKSWSSNYVKYLEKIALTGDDISCGLDDFLSWLVQELKGDETFFSTSLAAFKKQVDLNKETCHFLQDPEGVEMYHSIPAGKRSKHGLPTRISKKPETKLETMLGELTHSANCGMQPELADVLTLRVASQHNQNREYRLRCNKDADCHDRAKGAVPGHLADYPRFRNGELLRHLNELASSHNVAPHFPDCKTLPPNTGEKFLSEYFYDQVARNASGMSEGKRCICEECSKPQSTLTATHPMARTGTIASTDQEHQSQAVIPQQPAQLSPPSPSMPETIPKTSVALPSTPPEHPVLMGSTIENPPKDHAPLASTMPRRSDHCTTFPAAVQLAPPTALLSFQPNIYHPTTPYYRHLNQLVYGQPLAGTIALMPSPFHAAAMSSNPHHALMAYMRPQNCMAARNGFCCEKYQQHSFYRLRHGKKKLGRIPHDRYCHVKETAPRKKRRKV